MSQDGALLEPWRRIWFRLCKLRATGTLGQAIGVPIRHMLAVWGLVLCLQGAVGLRTYALAGALWVFSGLGITAGVHRLWTHHSYRATAAMEVLLLIMFATADQGPIVGWALTHTIHHRSADTDGDPHDRTRGFWHAHFGWLFSSNSFLITRAEHARVVSQLGRLVRFHDACYLWLDPLFSLGLPTLLASRWGETRAGFFVAGALRWAIVQHVTFFVNSVAHGEIEADSVRSFARGKSGIGPRVSLLVTVLGLGEGWHDYHHLFPWDYAAAELGAWDQWNPTKVFIDMCFHLGLCRDRKRCPKGQQLARRERLRLDKCDGQKSGTYVTVGPPFLRFRVLQDCPQMATKLSL
eukprot:TRINITY_DN37490_c0_g1_i2.p1 TRINITY_DN37490_c0_g1~~TRINITY_DN37490_c0_g1_i2.p1  ORF type:complete len:351 (-),score=42.43 TRINITY_DN37490_c0_g1_i2:140-1192(-)